MKPPSLSSPDAVRLLAAALLAASASPALAVTPFKMRIPIGPIVAAAPVPSISIPGYDPLTGMFQSPIGSFTWDGTASTYTLPSGTAFGITGPVTLALAATADGVKAAMRDNPGSLAGSLALAWLLDQGFEYVNGSWMLEETLMWISATPVVEGTDRQAMCQQYFNQVGYGWCTVGVNDAPPYAGVCTCNGAEQAIIFLGTTSTRNATQTDWDNLPGPIPEVSNHAVGSELPYALYMPAGVAVQNNFTITDLNTGTVHHCTNGGCD